MNGIDVDRNGRGFGGTIAPDETIAGTVSASALGTMEDPVVAAAARWISSQSLCR